LSLFKICPIPKETFPALRKALEDKDPYVRIYSAGALGKMRNDDKAFSTLLGALEANDDDLRRTAIQVLGGAGLNAVPTILACTKSTKGLVRNAGASALAFLADEFHRNARPFPQVAIKQLEVLLEDKDPEIVLWAIYVSSKIAHQVYDLLPRLIVCLQHPNDSIRRHAAAAVSKFGMVSIFAVPFLMTQINRETDDNVKEAMLLSLHTIVTEQIREKVAKILWRRVGPHSK
jgi:HEAT repeat protein